MFSISVKQFSGFRNLKMVQVQYWIWARKFKLYVMILSLSRICCMCMGKKPLKVNCES